MLKDYWFSFWNTTRSRVISNRELTSGRKLSLKAISCSPTGFTTIAVPHGRSIPHLWRERSFSFLCGGAFTISDNLLQWIWYIQYVYKLYTHSFIYNICNYYSNIYLYFIYILGFIYYIYLYCSERQINLYTSYKYFDGRCHKIICDYSLENIT
jgi:hypothetical protein